MSEGDAMMGGADRSDITTTQATTVVLIPCEVYSRVVGYLRPVTAWNEGKRQEFADRVTFKLPGVEDERAHLDQ